MQNEWLPTDQIVFCIMDGNATLYSRSVGHTAEIVDWCRASLQEVSYRTEPNVN